MSSNAFRAAADQALAAAVPRFAIKAPGAKIAAPAAQAR
ncbi:Uncharacterised protein [Mycobacterium tuberculosis]|nr:Uncharacterised protein [Mycobacterium tuberculosis]